MFHPSADLVADIAVCVWSDPTQIQAHSRSVSGFPVNQLLNRNLFDWEAGGWFGDPITISPQLIVPFIQFCVSLLGTLGAQRFIVRVKAEREQGATARTPADGPPAHPTLSRGVLLSYQQGFFLLNHFKRLPFYILLTLMCLVMIMFMNISICSY